LKSWSLVKIGTTQAQRKLFFSLARTRREIERLSPGAPPGAYDADLVAKKLKVKVSDVNDMQQRLEGRDFSLDAPIGDGTSTHLESTPFGGEPQDEELEPILKTSQGLPEGDEGAGQVEEAEVVGANPLPGHEQPAEAIVPGVGAFHDPAARLPLNAPQERLLPFLGYASQKVSITSAEIARGLGLENPGGPQFTAIYNSLDALEGVQLVYVDSYYDVKAKAAHPGRRTERLVKKTVFKLRPRRRPSATRPVDDATVTASEPGDYVELGDGLWESLTAGYRFAVDRTYLNGLDTDLAQRLYSYLAKKDYRSRFYGESVLKIGRRLGLAKRSPSDIRSSLEPACQILKRPSGPERKVFLRSFTFDGARSALKLVVETNREVDAERRECARRSCRRSPPAAVRSARWPQRSSRITSASKSPSEQPGGGTRGGGGAAHRGRSHVHASPRPRTTCPKGSRAARSTTLERKGRTVLRRPYILRGGRLTPCGGDVTGRTPSSSDPSRPCPRPGRGRARTTPTAGNPLFEPCHGESRTRIEPRPGRCGLLLPGNG
jgi:hypothetical protein